MRPPAISADQLTAANLELNEQPSTTLPPRLVKQPAPTEVKALERPPAISAEKIEELKTRFRIVDKVIVEYVTQDQ